jgi:hypothetical protein
MVTLERRTTCVLEREEESKPDKIAPSKFLRTLDPFTVYDAAELAMDYVKEVGLYPSWPVHSAQRAQIDIIKAGGSKGAWMDTSQPLQTVCYGYEVAEAVCKSQVPAFEPLVRVQGKFVDLREAYEHAVHTLEEAGR